MTDAWTKAVEAGLIRECLYWYGEDYEWPRDCDDDAVEQNREAMSAALRAALASLEAEGYVLVPKKMTLRMSQAWDAGTADWMMSERKVSAGWQAALAAAPRLPGTEEK